ncbi:MAG: hypothetical protein AAF558_01170 [Verrucomicrobiota bacterium]
MNSRIFLTACFALPVFCGAIDQSLAQTQLENSTNPPLSTEITTSRIGKGISLIGNLGKPLGRKMEITGKPATSDKAPPNALRIATVDGRKLSSPISIEIRGQLRIEPDVGYTLRGYETGEYVGYPEWIPLDEKKPYRFYTYFVLTKLVAIDKPKPTPPATVDP